MSAGAAGLMLLMASAVYVPLTSWKELSLVRSGNTAAGVALGGAIALLMRLIAYRMVDLILRDVPGRIANDKTGAATVLAAAKLSAAMILAAGLWDPVLQRL